MEPAHPFYYRGRKIHNKFSYTLLKSKEFPGEKLQKLVYFSKKLDWFSQFSFSIMKIG